MHQHHRDLVRLIRLQRVKSALVTVRVEHVIHHVHVRHGGNIIGERSGIVKNQRNYLSVDLNGTGPVIVIEFQPGVHDAFRVAFFRWGETQECGRTMRDRRGCEQSFVAGLPIGLGDDRNAKPNS